jgi:hypothetical protein
MSQELPRRPEFDILLGIRLTVAALHFCHVVVVVVADYYYIL